MTPVPMRRNTSGSGPTPNGNSTTASTKKPSTSPTSPPCRSASRKSRRNSPAKPAMSGEIGRRSAGAGAEVVERQAGRVREIERLVRRRDDPPAGGAMSRHDPLQPLDAVAVEPRGRLVDQPQR